MSPRRAAVLLAASIPFSFVVGSVSPIGELGLLAALGAFVLAARSAPGFSGGAFRGAVAGSIAGVLVLGVGFRLAMRVVALTDATRTPEFTVGGTAFILIGIGVMLGAVTGAYLGGLRHLLDLRRASVVAVSTVAIVLMLFGDSEVRSELFGLGLGAWVNIPLFGSIVIAYGSTQDAISRRLDRRFSGRRTNSDDVEPARVQ